MDVHGKQCEDGFKHESVWFSGSTLMMGESVQMVCVCVCVSVCVFGCVEVWRSSERQTDQGDVKKTLLLETQNALC